MVVETFGDMLYYPDSESLKEFPSPEALKERIIISTKPPKEYLEAKNVKENDDGTQEEKESDEEAWGKEVPDLQTELEYAKVGIAGVPADTTIKKTKAVEDNWTPVWDEEFIFPLTVPELALLRIEVHEHDKSGKDDFAGQICLPVSELRQGFRAVPLFDRKGMKFKSPGVFASPRRRSKTGRFLVTMAAAAGSRPPPIPDPASQLIFSDSDASGSDGDGDEAAGHGAVLEDSIFAAYLQISGRASADLSKIRSFLASAAGRGPLVSCLICLERVRPGDPAWSCASGCHALFHLICIQSWAQQSSHRPPSVTSPASAAAASSDWPCPKCRLPYPRTQVPRSYLCFCGKVEDPPPDPWILPHSCGEVCDRPLRGQCGHRCLLLCHPGPCPPCPKLVSSRCFCGSREDVRRCAQKLFSCNKPCSKPLPCQTHRCPERCHEGPCPPCQVREVYSCACGKTKEERECSEREFRCEARCTGMLGCGKHVCDRGCHSGPCGDCPLQGRRTCPCGKKEYKGVSCDIDVPTCGSTCEKTLICKIHRCPERCHRGPCVETCRMVVMKSCRCGSLKKEVGSS
ncbi:hypothetical protein B296_00046181 [Ensete ventricosum]|uniref:RING-type domain-containing protein n=1 Tax=Ensete ventricosum TaxID=4639 RepID=A0A426Y916_ENSVE|nr:hypothetical protein B296_00046181 [Ensete ventricosum]